MATCRILGELLIFVCLSVCLSVHLYISIVHCTNAIDVKLNSNIRIDYCTDMLVSLIVASMLLCGDMLP